MPMKRLVAVIRAIGKNPYLEVVAGILIISVALYELFEDVEQLFHTIKGMHIVFLFGLLYLARTLTISFDGFASIDIAEQSRFHQQNQLIRFIHRISHSPHVEIAVGIMLFIVGVVEIWENVKDEMTDFQQWHSGLIILGVYLILRSVTALVKGLILFEEAGFLRRVHAGWVMLFTSPWFGSVVGVALILIGVVDEVHNLSFADPFEVEEYHAFIIFGIVNVLKFFPDAYDGIVLTERDE
jgi:ABC-type nickel/cobalt efflux system permease component RcnA